MSATVRPISVNDILGFWEVLDSVARVPRHLALLEAPPLAEVERSVRSNVVQGRIHFIAEDGARIVGWCDISPHREPGFTHIGRLGMGVRADHRRQGLGRQLLMAALDRTAADGLVRIELEVLASNVPAVHLYRSAGFVREGIRRQARYLDGEWDDMVMMVRL